MIYMIYSQQYRSHTRKIDGFILGIKMMNHNQVAQILTDVYFKFHQMYIIFARSFTLFPHQNINIQIT